MDELDRKIIKELEIDGRQSYAVLSSKLGISISTAERRVKQLLKEKYINVRAVKNIFKMGWQANALVSIDIDIKKEKEICNTLCNRPEIHYVGKVYGRYDVVLFVHLEDNEKLHNFIQKEISTIDGINKIEVNLIAKIYKGYGGFSRHKYPIDNKL